MAKQPAERFTRPRLDRFKPKRNAANFYKASSDAPHQIAGVPIDTVEDAVVAAVRMGYKVAESQIDSSAKFAERLRNAGDRAAGKNSERQALDATEQIVFKALMAGLSWFEGAVADDEHPLRRLASAELRLLGSLFGISLADKQKTAPSTAAADDAPPPRSRVPRPRPYIKHLSDAAHNDARRAVRIADWDVTVEAVGRFALIFYHDAVDMQTISGELLIGRTGDCTLMIRTSAATATGRYKAAICDADGLQLGYLEIII